MNCFTCNGYEKGCANYQTTKGRYEKCIYREVADNDLKKAAKLLKMKNLEL
jgi:hypothetical protein